MSNREREGDETVDMDVPKRKQIRLREYDYSQNNAYFLTLCTMNRQPILCNIVGDGLLHVPQQRIPGIPNMSPYVALTHVGAIIEDAIQYLDQHYANIHIDQFVIMPNHVHLIVLINISEDNRVEAHGTCRSPSPTEGNRGVVQGTCGSPSPTNAIIPKLVSSLKRFTNKQCGGEIWQRSYYDHVIRNEADYQQIWKYIEGNPLKWREDELYL